jgi:hypothetical protein
MKQLFMLILALGLIACSQQTEIETAQGDWITGTKSEQIKTIEKHFRGFDHAMIETDYRFQELYWAGQDQNWEYAEYQLEEMVGALENGLERRPKRAASAEQFMTNILPEMQKSIEKRDPIIFERSFEVLTINCNSCHAMENVAFINVQIPSVRRSSVKK